ncbi:MAG: dihydropteroate synthase family protein [Opitutaceae bacterium]|jgi:dihydropteroate synthase|nr:dihydropteroate synthase family protein [Opitutaceae bacterium]
MRPPSPAPASITIPAPLNWQSPHGRPLPAGIDPAGLRTLVMAILNVTPDSFSDGGQFHSTRAVVDRAGMLLEEGADLLDVGGESTRPGHMPVSEAEEQARVLPVIEALRKAFPATPLSIDTHRASVARAAIRAGADIINDIWGGMSGMDVAVWRAWREAGVGIAGATPQSPIPPARSEKPDKPKPLPLPYEAKNLPLSAGHRRQPDNSNKLNNSNNPDNSNNSDTPAPPPPTPHTAPPDSTSGAANAANAADAATPPISPMARVMAEARCPVILMHNRVSGRDYTDFWPDVLLDLRASIAMARAAGVAENQLWLDPGIGFAKDAAENLEVLRSLGRIAALGHPVLLGTSRKSTIGRVLDEPMPARRGAGTAATLVWGVQQGARMVRVHDVAAMRPFLRMADAIRSGLMWRKAPPILF